MADYNVTRQHDFDASTASPLTDVGARSRFLTKTYVNLTGAILAFAAIETLIFSCFANEIVALTQTNARFAGFFLLALCLGGPFIGNAIIGASKTRFGHYCALAFYVLMYVALFLPILSVAILWTDGGLGLVGEAAALSVAIFVALSAAVFVTRKDFSFLRTGLVFASFAVLGIILASFFCGFQLGIVFTGAMIILACLYILYDTSNVMLHCDESCDVIAAVELFASIMMLFFYILRLFLSSRN